MRTVKAPFLSALIRVHNNSVIETIIIVMFDDGHSGNRKGHIPHLNRNAYCCVVFDKKFLGEFSRLLHHQCDFFLSKTKYKIAQYIFKQI